MLHISGISGVVGAKDIHHICGQKFLDIFKPLMRPTQLLPSIRLYALARHKLRIRHVSRRRIHNFTPSVHRCCCCCCCETFDFYAVGKVGAKEKKKSQLLEKSQLNDVKFNDSHRVN